MLRSSARRASSSDSVSEPLFVWRASKAVSAILEFAPHCIMNPADDTNNARDPVPAYWDATNIVSQKGKKAIVTGANSGIGFVTALELARRGADVVLACRSAERGVDAVTKIQDKLQCSPEAGSGEVDVNEFMTPPEK